MELHFEIKCCYFFLVVAVAVAAAASVALAVVAVTYSCCYCYYAHFCCYYLKPAILMTAAVCYDNEHLIAISLLRPVWITFQSYNFSVVAVVAAIYGKTIANGQPPLLKSYRNCLYYDFVVCCSLFPC